MASPVGHALVGIGLATIAVRVTGASPSPVLWLGSVIASGMPDLDVLGVMFGLRLNRVHRRATHSLIVLSVLVLAALWASCRLGAAARPDLVLVWSVATLSHPIVDALATGPQSARAGFGVPLFWPVLSRRWYMQRPLVRSPSLANYTSSEIWRALLPELRFFGSTCVTMIVLGHVL